MSTIAGLLLRTDLTTIRSPSVRRVRSDIPRDEGIGVDALGRERLLAREGEQALRQQGSADRALLRQSGRNGGRG